MGYKYDKRKSKMKGWGMGNFMLYKSMAIYLANSRGLKSQLLLEIENKVCSIRRSSSSSTVI